MDEDAVAAAIHETWRLQARQEGWVMEPGLDRPFPELDEAAKENNRDAARRIPRGLAIAGLGLRRSGEGPEPALPEGELRAMLERCMEPMAEAEHDGWMEDRVRRGWRYAPVRDDAHRRHPMMIPYARLPDAEKDKDRSNIRHYPDFAARAGYRIVKLA
ncbi:MAG TPA: RyR domain-containing protein [Caulobacteraceae bacterium]|nr:RyR domain-containing protein [Caulobacteraceae bacterium]